LNETQITGTSARASEVVGELDVQGKRISAAVAGAVGPRDLRRNIDRRGKLFSGCASVEEDIEGAGPITVDLKDRHVEAAICVERSGIRRRKGREIDVCTAGIRPRDDDCVRGAEAGGFGHAETGL
jgi:hypothetical protein